MNAKYCILFKYLKFGMNYHLQNHKPKKMISMFRVFLVSILLVSIMSLLGCKNQRIDRLYKKGYEYYNGNKVKKALKKYERILDLNEHHYKSINYVGLCYNYLGEHKEALRYYKEYRKYDSTSGIAELNIAIANMRLKQFNEAEKYFAIAATKEGTSFDILYFNLGELHADYYKNYEKAIFYYNMSTVVDSNFVDGYIQLGDSYIAIEKWNDAIPCYIKACNKGIVMAGIYNNLGYCYMELNNFDKAIQEYDRSIKIDCYDPSSQNNLGYCYMLKGDFKMAIEVLENSISNFEQNSWGYRNLGFVYMKMKNKELSCSYLNMALENGFLEKWDKKYLKELFEYCEL